MQQGTVSVRPSVRLSVCPICRPLQQRAAVCCCGPGEQAISIDIGVAHAVATAPPQHGAQQQRRAVMLSADVLTLTCFLSV